MIIIVVIIIVAGIIKIRNMSSARKGIRNRSGRGSRVRRSLSAYVIAAVLVRMRILLIVLQITMLAAISREKNWNGNKNRDTNRNNSFHGFKTMYVYGIGKHVWVW